MRKNLAKKSVTKTPKRPNEAFLYHAHIGELIELLNSKEKPATTATDQLLLLIEKLQQIESLLTQSSNFQSERLDAAVEEANKLFATWQFIPGLSVSTWGRTGQAFISEWDMPIATASSWPFMGWACLALRRMAVHGELNLLRRCQSGCGTWLLAKRKGNVWCSTKCKTKGHQSTEEFKAQRRENYRYNKAHPKKRAAKNAPKARDRYQLNKQNPNLKSQGPETKPAAKKTAKRAAK